MPTVLTLTQKRPAQQQFGLDTFTESYKCDATADVVLTDPTVPQMGSAHPDYPFMFVTARPCSETGESASVLDLIYTGCLTDDGVGNPILPDQQDQHDTQIQSASSSRASTGGTLTSPATLQFYAPSNVLTYVSFGGPGTTVPSDPSGTPVVITWTVGDTSYSIGNLVTDLINVFFSLQVNLTSQSNEIVAGQYWQNTFRKTLIYVPFIFDVPSGPFVTLASPGNGFTVGDTITISGTGSATLVVDSVGSVFGGGTGIIAYHETSDTFTVGATMLPGSGGTGSGSLWNVMIIP